MSVRDDRRGMTLVELIIITVLGSVVLVIMYEVLLTNQRTYQVQNEQVQNRQTLRSGLDVLRSELREISPGDGDLVSMQPTSITIRAQRGLGIVCVRPTSTGMHPTVTALRVGNYLQDDSVRVYYENHPDRDGDNQWRTALAEPQDTSGSVTCPSADPTPRVGQTVRLRGIRWGTQPDSFSTGAPIRAFVHYQYLLGTHNGESYLIRVAPDGSVAPLVGPLAPSDGVEFEYLDATGAAASTEANVREITVKLRTAPRRSGNQTTFTQDSLSTRIFTRNTN